MSRAFALVTFACAVLRLVGHIAVAISNEIDEACSTYLVECPPAIPEWMGAE